MKKNGKKEKKDFLDTFCKVMGTIVAIIGILSVILLIAGLFAPPSTRVRDSAFIEETLETADDNTHAEEKAMLADFVKNQYNCDPEKVVFYIYAPHDAMDFDVKIYYKDAGTWFRCLVNGSSPKISQELYDRLSYLATQ